MNTFLSSIASAHPLLVVALVHPLAQVAALERGRSRGRRGEWPATSCSREVVHEAVDEVAPAVPVERAGADVDLRVVARRAPAARRPVAPVVVGVDVEHDEAALRARGRRGRRRAGVELVVQAARALDLLLGERLAPHVETPRGVGRARTRTVAGAVEVDLEPRAVHDDREPARRAVMRSVNGILLPPARARRRGPCARPAPGAGRGRRGWRSSPAAAPMLRTTTHPACAPPYPLWWRAMPRGRGAPSGIAGTLPSVGIASMSGRLTACRTSISPPLTTS